MIAEDLEFQISQYVDGTLSAAEHSQVDDLLKVQPEARKLLADYQRINSQLAQLRDKHPVDWNQFAGQISSAIDGEEPAVAGHIGWTRWSGQLRIAAGVLIVATLGIVVGHNLHHGPVTPVSQPAARMDVDGPKAEVAAGKSTEEISVGPSARFTAGEADAHYAQAPVAPGPSKVVISQALVSDPKPKDKSQSH